MPPLIRPCETADLPAILDIYNDAILHTTSSYHYDTVTLAERERWFAAKQQAGLPVLVADDERGVVGFSTYGPFRPWAGYRFTVENTVYVAADHRGRGIGRSLMEPLIVEAKAQRYHVMVAGVDAANAASVRLHRSLGFEQVAVCRAVGFKFERWLNLLFFELFLQDQ